MTGLEFLEGGAGLHLPGLDVQNEHIDQIIDQVIEPKGED
jgi:hypothetical protein